MTYEEILLWTRTQFLKPIELERKMQVRNVKQLLLIQNFILEVQEMKL